ncbi:hypothetical protein [Chromohalobacter nigrandesensis]|uniref:hypothetical protein n=1 Tax=Chromohalobacter nigrandesensis TaxID=119863 RepID=UPI001FF28000|nr:hypothetical protein [Chromohalobacter nigrandesensis]MCK0745457.1 hypothetical protein [Chromohalobacter nigrandesensis]
MSNAEHLIDASFSINVHPLDLSVGDLVQSLRFDSPFEYRRRLRSEFLEKVDLCDDFELLDLLGLHDPSNLLPWLIVSHIMMIGGSGSDLPSKLYALNENEKVRKLALSVIIINSRIDVIESDDREALRQYFIWSQLEEKDIDPYQKSSLLDKDLLQAVLDQKTLYTWITSNLSLMIDKGGFDPGKHVDFFEEIFREADFVQKELVDLLAKAVKKDTAVFYGMRNVRLSIDPFTKETMYSRWLKDAAKFMALGFIYCQYVSNVDPSQEFENKLRVFPELYKFDQSHGGFSFETSS